jgi:hypothetical protein
MYIVNILIAFNFLPTPTPIAIGHPRVGLSSPLSIREYSCPFVDKISSLSLTMLGICSQCNPRAFFARILPASRGDTPEAFNNTSPLFQKGDIMSTVQSSAVLTRDSSSFSDAPEGRVCSPRKLDANRNNSQKSTGPKTPEGKSRSSQNAVTHGLTSSRPILPPDEQESFNQFLHTTLEDLEPQGSIELCLARRIALLFFQLDRAAATEAHLLAAQSTSPIRQTLHDNQKELDSYLRACQWEEEANRKRKHPRLPFPPELKQLPDPVPTHQVLAGQFNCFDSSSTPFERLTRYTATLDRQLHRALKQLQTLQKLRSHSPSPSKGEGRSHSCATEQNKPTQQNEPTAPPASPSGVVASATTDIPQQNEPAPTPSSSITNQQSPLPDFPPPPPPTTIPPLDSTTKDLPHGLPRTRNDQAHPA